MDDAPRSLPDRRQYPVLLVDDEPFVLKLLAHQLGQLGFADVRSFSSAPAALTELDALAAAGAAAELVCCDLQMPELDGVALIRQLAGRGFRGAVVLVSGEDTRLLQTVHRLALAQGLNVLGALRKPVSPQQLRALLLEREAPASRPPSAAAPREVHGVQALREALAQGQLFNVYQPKVALRDGRLVGVESLVRWAHPRHGLVGPDAFVPLAEEHGLIDELLHGVLRRALRDARRWLDTGLPLSVAVNVSMDNLVHLDFPERVEALAREAGMPLSSLVLEVTESRLMRDPLATVDTLTRLRLKRCSLSIDDFGTGHSSLAQLRDLPFDELKLDKSFVHGAAHDPALRSIVQSSITLAQQLGLHTVAEGVEDAADWEALRSMDCELAQGYFMGRPMPADALPAWAADWRQRCPLLLG